MSLPKEELQQKILEELQKNPIVSYACKQHGVARSTLYRWLEEDSSFKNAFKLATKLGKTSILDLAKLRIIKLLNSQDERVSLETAKFYINKYDPEIVRRNKKQRNLDNKVKEVQVEIVNKESQYLKEILEFAKKNPSKLVGSEEEYQQEIEKIIQRVRNSEQKTS